jgi:hypothetical protein
MTDLPDVPQRFGATRFVIGVCYLLALIALLAGIALSVANVRGQQNPGLVGFVPFLGGLLGTLILMAAAEGLQVLLDIEEHLRAMRTMTEYQHLERDLVS